MFSRLLRKMNTDTKLSVRTTYIPGQNAGIWLMKEAENHEPRICTDPLD
jgi:hypothetical protein